jgi:hypothetical protein
MFEILKKIEGCICCTFSCGCCRIRSGCCYVVMTMLQASNPNVLTVSDGCYMCFIWVLHIHLCCKCFHLDVGYVFIHMLQVFHLNIAYILQWLHTCFPRVFDVCSKCFNCSGYKMFSSTCCKSRSGIAHVAVDPISSSRLLQLLGPRCMRVAVEGREQQVWETVRTQIETEWA